MLFDFFRVLTSKKVQDLNFKVQIRLRFKEVQRVSRSKKRFEDQRGLKSRGDEEQ